MTKDGEINAIFNPKRVRAPSVVVTGDSPNGPFGGFTNIGNPQMTHQDSITSSQPDHESIIGSQQLHPGGGGGRTDHSTDLESPSMDLSSSRPGRFKACTESCCSDLAQKMYFGVFVTILVTFSWVAGTHCIKFLYLNRSTYTTIVNDFDDDSRISNEENNSTLFELSRLKTTTQIFNAPFFASWFCTNFCFFFFPIYLLGRIVFRKCDKAGEILGDVLRGFRDRGFTFGRFLNRCILFTILWVFTTYLYYLSLRSLLATDVLALFATNVCCVYLLSWVILHEQFVGIRIVAVILCDTGIALLAYMDGITNSPTLGGVVLSALAAAGYAVFKVMFRKVMGDPMSTSSIGQVAFTFTIVGFLNLALLWPICLGFYLTGTEVMPADRLPWIVLLIAGILFLVFHILTQFSAAVTYNMFVTLGLITSVPVSAAMDIVLYGANFADMKLAGIILIAVGFFLVMFPENWPDYITRLLRKFGQALLRSQCVCCIEYAEIEVDNSKYHFVGPQREMGSRSPQRFINATSFRHRLSDGLHKIPPEISIRSCEMTDLSHNDNYDGVTYNPHGLHGPSVSSHGSQSSAKFHSYFGGSDERKKSETSFFNLGFRRKSTIYFAATDY